MKTPIVLVVAAVWLAHGALAQGSRGENTASKVDLDREIAAARAVTADPLPPDAAWSRIAGEVDDTPITLGEVLEEAVVIYAASMTEILARQRALSLEAARRGVEVDSAAFKRATRRFIERNARGRSLAETLREQHVSYERFERLMTLNAAVASMFRADQGAEMAAGPDPEDRKGRAWIEGLLSRYEIETDPAALPAGTHARVKAEWPLRVLLENHLAGRTPLRLDPEQAGSGSGISLVFDLPDGGRATAHLESLRVVEQGASGLEPGSQAFTALLPRLTPARFKVNDPDPKDPRLLVVAPASGEFPRFRMTDARARIVSVLRSRDLLAARLPDLKLGHLDRALESRARYVAFRRAMKERGIQVSKERVQARIRRMRESYQDQPFTWERALQMVGRNVLLETRRFEIADGVDQIIGTDVNESVLRAYYEAHFDHFGRATVTASHILISEIDPDTGRVDFTKAREKIKEVYTKLKAGAEFVEMVQEYSQDPISRRRGGDVGMFTLVSAYDEEFCRLAFALQENEISPPVRTRQGYHIIYCRKRTPPSREAYPFEKIKDIVRQDRQEDLRKRWLKQHVYGPMKVVNGLDGVWGEEEVTK
jgi:parvulin-like peptidyl-prolyl isomerase